jgi:hypothetical protein
VLVTGTTSGVPETCWEAVQGLFNLGVCVRASDRQAALVARGLPSESRETRVASSFGAANLGTLTSRTRHCQCVRHTMRAAQSLHSIERRMLFTTFCTRWVSSLMLPNCAHRFAFAWDFPRWCNTLPVQERNWHNVVLLSVAGSEKWRQLRLTAD